MQSIKFKSLEDFFEYLPDQEKGIVKLLRTIVLDCLPNCEEKLAYNVPYYYCFRRICFIWPAAIPWGKVEKSGVMLGFCQGNLLNDELNYFDKSNRKQVYTKTFINQLDVQEDKDIIKTYLQDASVMDDHIRSTYSSKK